MIKKIIINIKSSIIIIKDKVKSIISLITTCFITLFAIFNNKDLDIIISNLSFVNFIKNNFSILIIISVIFTIIYILILFIKIYIRVSTGKLTTKIFNNKKIHILNGDVHKNFLWTLKTNDFINNYNQYVFIYAFPMNGNIAKIWPGSPTDKLIKFLDRNYNLLHDKIYKPSNQIQNSIDNFLKDKNKQILNYNNLITNIDVKYRKKIQNFNTLYPLNFGDMIESNIVIFDDKNNKTILHFLFVANYIDNDDMIYTTLHNEIIISNCLNYINNLQHYEKIVMSLMGVHDYNQHLLNVYAYLINSFATTCLSNNNNVLKELTISCQNEDIKKWNVEFGQLENYANLITSYYKLKKS